MVSLLKWLWQGLCWLGGLFLPILTPVRSWRRTSPAVRWGVHFVLVLLVLAGLAFLNYHLDLERVLVTPWAFLRRGWLPLLFLLVYLNGWLGWWLWRLLAPGPQPSAFPDLDDAWARARRALDRAHIDPSGVPLFLVLGRPAASPAGLFQASGLDFVVRPPPSSETPVNVYAGAEGIFVTCEGASLLSRECARLWGDGVKDEPAGGETPADAPDWTPDAASEGSGPGPRRAARHDKGGEAENVLTLVAEPEAEAAGPVAPSRSRRPAPVKAAVEAEEQAARLRHLCRLIVRDRHPYCPVNGVLLLVPFAATADDADAARIGVACRRDLAVVEESLQVQCPVVAVVCDGETVPGFRELIARFPEKNRERRFGTALPFVAGPDLPHRPEMIDGGVAWLCLELAPSLVYRVLQADAPAARGNAELYRLLDELRERSGRLARTLTRADAGSTSSPWLAGCYLAGTGRDPSREQAFVADVIRELIENQNFVAWTPAARAEEAARARWTRWGYVALCLAVAGLLAAILF